MILLCQYKLRGNATTILSTTMKSSEHDDMIIGMLKIRPILEVPVNGNHLSGKTRVIINFKICSNILNTATSEKWSMPNKFMWFKFNVKNVWVAKSPQDQVFHGIS